MGKHPNKKLGNVSCKKRLDNVPNRKIGNIPRYKLDNAFIIINIIIINIILIVR